jgi:hypothetical protein
MISLGFAFETHCRSTGQGKGAIAPAVDTGIEPDAASDACMDEESSEEEDLLSGTGSSNNGPPPAPPAPPTVLDPKDFEECDDEEPVVTPPGLPEPVKESIDTNALDAKHNLKEAIRTPVETPDKVVLWMNLPNFVIFPRSCLVSTRCIIFLMELSSQDVKTVNKKAKSTPFRLQCPGFL